MSLIKRNKRFRGPSLDSQLKKAVKELEAVTTSGDDATRDSLKVRITALQRMAARQEGRNRQKRKDKLAQALLEIERLTAEVSRLKQELAAKPGARPLTEVDLALQNYEKEKGGATCR
jgi:hypothetical protein